MFFPCSLSKPMIFTFKNLFRNRMDVFVFVFSFVNLSIFHFVFQADKRNSSQDRVYLSVVKCIKKSSCLNWRKSYLALRKFDFLIRLSRISKCFFG